MVKVGIFEKDSEKKVYLKLQENDRDILLRFADVDGTWIVAGTVLIVEKYTGRVRLPFNVNPEILKELGWDSTRNGALIVVNQPDDDC